MFLRQTPVGSVKDPATGEQQEKHVFVVFYAGERARTKVLKVCRQAGYSVCVWTWDGFRGLQGCASVVPMNSAVGWQQQATGHWGDCGGRLADTHSTDSADGHSWQQAVS